MRNIPNIRLGMIVFVGVLVGVLIRSTSGFACFCSNGNSTQNCTDDYNCHIDVHLNVTTKEPLSIEQNCVPLHGLLAVNACPVPLIDPYDNLLRMCCQGDYCNMCPQDILIDEIDKVFLNTFYDLFPESCNLTRETYSIYVTPAITFTSSSSSSSSQSITPMITPTQSVTTTNPPEDNKFYVNLFIAMISFGFIVIVAVIVVVCIVFQFLRRAKLRKVRETPYSTNQTFVDFNITGENSCSSNALTETRLLHTRTLSDDIKLSNQLGRGKFGNVYRGIWGHQTIAVKVYDSHHESEWLREAEIYDTHMLNHTNILKVHGTDKKETGNDLNYMAGDTIHLWTVFEYHPNGNLQEYLSSNVIHIKAAFILATSFLDGLHYLHTSVKTGSNQKPGIAHRDLKSPNILVKADFSCCIGDLGLAIKQLNGTGVDIIPTNKLSGTRRYLPPEILQETMNFERFQNYVFADIYSASLVLWEIFQCVSFEDDTILYKSPYYEHVSPGASLENMKKLVVTMGIRPNLKRFQMNESLNFLTQILIESWSNLPLARPSALNINKKIKAASTNTITD